MHNYLYWLLVFFTISILIGSILFWVVILSKWEYEDSWREVPPPNVRSKRGHIDVH